MTATCEFCGTTRNDNASSCENCGSNSIQAKAKRGLESNTNDGLAQAISLILKDARYSRFYLTTTALLFAVLFGAFWHKSYSTALAPEQPAQSINYSELAQTNSSNPEAIAVYKKKAIFSMAVADVHALKIMVFQHYLDTGKWPENLLDLGLDKDSMKSRSVNGVWLERDGVLAFELTKDLGSNMHVKLVPEMVMGGSNLQWSCFSNLPSPVLAGTYCDSI